MGYEIDKDEAIDKMSDPETFDVLEYVRGAHTPEETVTLYTDAGAALALSRRIEAEENAAKADKNEVLGLDEYSEDEDLTDLTDRLDASALIVSLKGMAPTLVDAMSKHHKATRGAKPDAEFFEDFNNELIAKTIVQMTRPNGAVNKKEWTAALVAEFTASLYATEAEKLFTAVIDLTYVGSAFERIANTDFLSRR